MTKKKAKKPTKKKVKKMPEHNPQFNPNGFTTPQPGPACFLYNRAESDPVKTPVHVHVDKQPMPKGTFVRLPNGSGSFTYSEAEEAEYQTWRTKALPRQPPTTIAEVNLAGDWLTALTYSYQSQTGYYPPPAGDSLTNAEPTDLPGVVLPEGSDMGHGAEASGGTNDPMTGMDGEAGGGK